MKSTIRGARASLATLVALLLLLAPALALAQHGGSGLHNPYGQVIGGQGQSDEAPTWFADLRGGVLPAGATFTRASSRSCTNASGVIVQLSTNVPCFYTDSATLQSLGYLAEPPSTNAILWSQDFSQAYWNKAFGGTGSAPVVAQNDATYLAPDGTQTAAKIIFNAGAGSTSGDLSMVNSSSLTVAVGSSYGGSVYARAAAGTKMIFRHAGGSIYALWTATGGWDRVSSIETAPGPGTTTTMDIGIRQGVNGTINSSATVWLWGAQFETAGVGVTSPIPTAGSAVTRAGDVLSMPLTSLRGWNPNVGGVLAMTGAMGPTVTSGTYTAAQITDAAQNNNVTLYGDYGGNWSMDMWSGGVRQQRPSGVVPPPAFTSRKYAAGWSASRLQLARDGVFDGALSGSYALPVAPTTLYIGGGAGGSQFSGTIKDLAYYVGARSDAGAQRVSQ